MSKSAPVIVLLAALGAAALYLAARRPRSAPASAGLDAGDGDTLDEVVITARRLPTVGEPARAGDAGAGGWWESVRMTLENIGDAARDALDTVLKWTPPAAAARFASLFRDAARRYDLPENLLERVAYQESRFRDDVITGRTKSSAGALGIMQIVPRYHPGVDPLDPAKAIPYAANYLRGLYQQFGTWRLALAAYNWGPGNISKYKDRPDLWPAETVAYARDITRDLGLV